jgi:TRAP-type C4-dicarboxylate transport system permease small subunit
MSQTKSNAFIVLKRLHELLAKLFTWLSALVVAVLVILMVVSSLMRYVIGSPFHFTEELSALFFMTLSVLPIAYVARVKNHIRIRIILDRIPHPAHDRLLV